MEVKEEGLSFEKADFQAFVLHRVYQSLPNRWWNSGTRAIDSLFRRKQPSPFWVGVVFIQLTTLAISLGASNITGEQIITAPFFFQTHILWMLWVIFFVIIWQNQIMISTKGLNDIIIPHVASQNDLFTLQRTIVQYSNPWLQFLFSVSVSAITTTIAIQALGQANYLFQPVGLSVFYFVEYATMALYYYFLIVYIGIFLRLGKLDFTIFDTNPSSSVPILQLERLARNFILAVASIFALNLLLIFFAFGAGVFNAMVIVLVVCVYTLPIVLLFVATQVSMAKIIQRLKLNKLSDIQNVIRETEKNNQSPTKEQLEILEKLLDYHDRVRSTPDSKFSLAAITNFIGSLLLPIIATILGNLNLILSLLGLPPIP